MADPQQPAQLLPWQNGTFQIWQVGQTFIGPDGTLLQVYPDPNSPTGYTLKATGKDGSTSFSPGPSPNDPNAQAQWFANSPYGKRLEAAELAAAQQNAFNNSITQGNLGVSQATQQATAQYQQGLLQNAREQLAIQRQGQQLQTGYQTLDLGSRLRGARDYFQYQQMAAGARGNPLVQGAVQTWANMSQDRPTGGGAWAGGNPEPMTLQALTNDLGAGGGGGGGGVNSGGNAVTDGSGTYQTPTIAAFDEFLKNPHKSSANYLGTLDDTQLGLLQSYADVKGHDWNTVQGRYNTSRVKQGVAGSRAA